MSPEVARQVIGLMIDAVQNEAKSHLPSYVQESWMTAMSSLLENIDTVKLEAEIVEIIDHREDGK